jgi:hypothetical protein
VQWEDSLFRSMSSNQEFTCSHCKRPYRAKVWVLIDVEERPDLFVKCRDKAQIRAFLCPHCHNFEFEFIPLLLYYPKADRVVFVASRRWSDEGNRNFAANLTLALCTKLRPEADGLALQQMVTKYLELAVVLDDMQLMLGQVPDL